jgi:hypothetical protein
MDVLPPIEAFEIMNEIHPGKIVWEGTLTIRDWCVNNELVLSILLNPILRTPVQLYAIHLG